MSVIRHFCLVLICLLIISSIHAAAPPLLEWQKCMGGAGQDIPVKMIRSIDGGIFLLGTTGSQGGDVTNNHGSSDLWLVKLDTNGTLLWQKTFGGSNLDVGTGLVQLDNGNLVLAGYTASFNGDVTFNHGNFDAWLLETDINGTILWQKTFGGSQVELCYSMIKTHDGGFLLGGGTFSNDGDVSGSHGDEDFWLIKSDSLGNFVWQRSLGGSGLDVCYSILENSNFDVTACGSSNSVDGDVNNPHGGFDFWVTRLDENGSMIWNKTYGGSNNESASTIIQMSNSNYLLGGYSLSSDGDVTDNHGSSDIWLNTIDEQGNLLTQRSFGGSGSDVAYSITPTNEGGYLLSGGTNSNDWDIPSSHGMEDVWLAKTDSSFNLEWTKTYGGNENERPSAVMQMPDGGFLVSAYSYSNQDDVNGNHGNADFWFFRLSCKMPVSSFQAVFDSLCNGTQETFVNNSVHSSQYQWYSNGITFSHSQNPVLQLSTPGSYEINLVSETCYSIDSSSHAISVLVPPVPVITQNKPWLCPGDTLVLSTQLNGNCLWNTGETTSSIRIVQGGSYQVAVSMSGCSVSSSANQVNAYPAPALSLGPDTNICSSSSYTIHAGTGFTAYQWQDGTTDSLLTVHLPGTYTVSVSDGYCAASSVVHIDTVSCAYPHAVFSASAQTTCQGSTVTFQNLSQNITSCTWTFPGGFPSTSTELNPTVVYDSAGSYNVMLTVSNIFGSHSTMYINYVVVVPLPSQPVISVAGNFLTSTASVHYQWYFNNVPIPGATDQTYIATQNGNYSVEAGDNHLCTALSDPVYISISGVIFNGINPEFQVYPNPVSDWVHIQFPQTTIRFSELNIFNSFGQLIRKIELDPTQLQSEFQLDLSNLNPGTYLLQIQGGSEIRSLGRIEKL